MHHFKHLSLLTFLVVSGLHADIMGGELSLGAFNHSASGQASYASSLGEFGSMANAEDTLGFSETQDLFFKTYLEHPFPFLPNVKLGHNRLGHSGTGTVTDFSWGELTHFTGTVNSKLSLIMSDATLYYEIVDNWVEIDAGLTLRYISGDTSVNHEYTDFSTRLLLLYTKARFNVPDTDLSLQLETNAVGYSDTIVYDYELSARYSLAIGIGIEAGYKSFHLKSDDLTSGLNADLDFSGPYAAAVWDF